MQKQIYHSQVDDAIVEERNEEIKSIELEMELLAEITTDLSLMINTQGYDLDFAAQHVDIAEINVHEAVQHIEVAEKYHRKVSKKLVGMIITSAGVVVGGGVLTILSPVAGIITAGCGLAAGVTFTAMAIKNFRKK